MYTAGSVNFQSGGSSINYSYTPNENSKSATTTAYEYCFGSTMDTTMAVTLKSIDSTGVDLKYAYSATKLDKSSTFTGESDYTPQILQNRGDKVYIYILVTPTDDNIPTTFISSVKFWYGQPSTITYNINGQDVNEVVVKGQELNEPTLPVLDNGYSCIGWYSDAEYTQMVDFNLSSRKENLYARYPNLPEDYLAFDEAQQCYYIKRGTSKLPHNLALPSTYKGYNVTYIEDVAQVENGAFYGWQISRVILPNTITSIGNHSFRDCRNLTSITIFGDITYIGEGAFINCYALAEIYNLSNTLTLTQWSTDNGYISAFANIINTSKSSKTRVFEINDMYYYKAEDNALIALAPSKGRGLITAVVLDSRTTHINTCAFVGYLNLTNIDLSKCTSLKVVYGYAFHFSGIETITLPRSLELLEEGAFHSATNLKSVDMSKCTNLTSIGANAFQSCTALTSIELPKNLQTIGGSAFSGCTSLQSVNLQDCTKLTSIGVSAFLKNSSLTSVILPSSLQFLGDTVFSMCTSLTTIDFSKCTQLNKVGFYSFDGTPLSYVDLSTCTNLQYIYNGAFNNCTKLTGVILPASLTYIGYAVFNNCSLLNNIIIPSNTTYIGDHAFLGCSALNSLTFENDTNWYKTKSGDDWLNNVNGENVILGTPSENATNFTSVSDYYDYYWYKK